MRIANLNGRSTIIVDDRSADVASASRGRFGPEPHAVLERWPEFVAWARDATLAPADEFDSSELGPPSPFPRQVFGIGLNYRAHAEEASLPIPAQPVVFTKFPSCIAGPFDTISLPTNGTTDWEVELVVVIGREARSVRGADAWDVIAGVTVGQDLSERTTQLAGVPPQFSLGKSLAGFGPTGPYLVTADELDCAGGLEISCAVDGTVVQSGNTGDLIFTIEQLVEYLSHHVTMYPGDLIFTGTPSGVGIGHTPPRFLQPGEVLTSRISGIGELRNEFVASA